MSNKYNDTPLGKKAGISEVPDASLLCPINRKESKTRESVDFALLDIDGQDVWNCFELSWLNVAGIPQSAVCRIVYPISSKSIVESKSLKLYLGSFYNTQFEDEMQLAAVIAKDLSTALDTEDLSIEMFTAPEWDEMLYPVELGIKNAVCLDKLIEFTPALELLNAEISEHKFYSDTFRSLCPVTSQPDWASYEISYKGPALRAESLLGYMLSYRNHAAFHEEVSEKVYIDLYNLLKPEYLSVSFNFLRRGGIDINPHRHSKNYPHRLDFHRKTRQ